MISFYFSLVLFPFFYVCVCVFIELEKAEKIYEDIIAAHPKHLAAHLLLIQNIESSTELKAQYPFTFAKSLKANNNNNATTATATTTTTTAATSTTTTTAIATTALDDSSSSLSSGASSSAEDKQQQQQQQQQPQQKEVDKHKLRQALERIVLLADNVIRDTDKDALLAYYGIKCDTRPDAAKIKT